jgi:4-amino-4-deoxy-L-arabinose transferase-like glycosyltransferase
VLSFAVLGQNEFAARFFPCLLGLLGVFFTWLFARKVYDEDTANLAAVVMGTSILYYAIAHINIIDMTVSFYLMLSLFAFYFYFKEGKKIWALVFYGAMALAVLSKGLIGIVLPGGVIFWFMIFTRRWDIIKKLLYPPGIILFFAFCAPWFYLVCKVNPDFFRFFFIQEHFLRYATKMHGRYEPFWFFIPVILGGLYPWVGGLFLSLKNVFSKKEDAVFLTVWFAVMFLFFSASSSKLIPYIIPLFPPLVLIIARNIMDALRANSAAKIRTLLVLHTVVAAAMIAAAAIIFGKALPIKDIDDVLLYKNVIISLVALTAVFALLMWFVFKKPAARVICLCVYGFLLLACAKPGFAIIAGERSTQKVAQNMLAYVKPADIIVNYDYYYQDSPFYFKRRVIITDWKGELEYGIANANPRERAQWIIDDADVPALLARPLENGRKMYFIVRDKSLNKYPFKQSTKFIEKIGKYNIYVREK